MCDDRCMIRFMWRSRVPIPIHIDEAKIKSNLSPNLIESPVSLMVVFDDIPVGSITERRIGRVLAIAQLIVSTFIDIESDRPASSNTRITRAVATGIAQTHTAWTPRIHLSLLKISIVREVTLIDDALPVMNGMLGGRYFPSR